MVDKKEQKLPEGLADYSSEILFGEKSMVLGANLKALAKKRGYSLQDIAKIIGTSTSTVYEWSNNRKPNDIVAITKLSILLKTPLFDLLWGSPDPNSEKTLSQIAQLDGVYQLEVTVKKKEDDN